MSVFLSGEVSGVEQLQTHRQERERERVSTVVNDFQPGVRVAEWVREQVQRGGRLVLLYLHHVLKVIQA